MPLRKEVYRSNVLFPFFDELKDKYAELITRRIDRIME